MTIKRKMKNRRGFTLAETLLAVLILLLVSVIVAQGVPVAKNVYQKVVLAANAQDILATAISSLRDELGTSWDVRVDDKLGNENEGTFVTYYSADTGARSKIFLGASDKGPIEIKLQRNVEVSGLGISENAKSSAESLASDSGTTDITRLYVQYDKVRYDEDNCTLTFTGLVAGPADDASTPGAIKALAQVDELTINVFMEKESGSGD